MWENDLPHQYDLFHFKSEQIPTTKKEKEYFFKNNQIIRDTEYWNKQMMRCVYGYTVPDAIEPGGDAYLDDFIAFWDGDDCHVPMYEVTFKNRVVHITGRQYFYLNFWPIYGLIEGYDVKGLMKPLFLDLDYFFARRIYMQIEQKKNSQETKGRQGGFSEKLAGMILGYNYTFIKSSVNIIIAGQQDDANHTFANTERGLNSLINTQFYKERAQGGDNQFLIKALKDDAEVRALTAKDKPQTASRFSPFFVVHEEVGKGKAGWSISAASYIDPSQMAQNIKTGFQIIVGTGGNMNEGVADLEERHFDPDKYNLLSFPRVWAEQPNFEQRTAHFTPKYLFWDIDKDGNSIKKSSLITIEKLIESKKGKDKYIAITQFPICDDNVFMIESGGFFGKEVSLLLQRRKNYIRTHLELNIMRRGRLEWKNQKNKIDGVQFVSDPDGWLMYIEEPEKDDKGNRYYNLYEAGTDSYDQDEAHSSDSKGATRIRKMYKAGTALYNCSVAWIVERPTIEEGGAETFFEHSAMVCMWYSCQNNIEYSNLRIFDWYRNHGLESLLKARPRLAFATKIKEQRATNPYGTEKSLKPHILAIAKDVLDEEYINRMYFLIEIDALLKFKYDPTGKKYNCDITIAFAEAEVSAKENEFVLVLSENDIQKMNKSRGLITYQMVQGRLIPKFV